MRLDEGGTKNYSESFLKREVAVIETTSADFDTVTSIPIDRIARSSPVDVPLAEAQELDVVIAVSGITSKPVKLAVQALGGLAGP